MSQTTTEGHMSFSWVLLHLCAFLDSLNNGQSLEVCREKYEAEESKKYEGIWRRSTIQVPTNLES